MNTKHLPLWATGLLMTASLLSSCEKDLEETITTPPTAIARPDSGTGGLFDAVASKKGIIKQGTFRGQPITYEEIDGKATWQGDILLTEEDLAPVDTSRSKPGARNKGAGMATKDHRWLNFRIPYEIGPGLNNTRINEAITEWQNKTPIRFVVRTNETDYVRFELSTANRSPVGRKGGKQIIEIANAQQTTGVILHEIGHAIGLEHEATRPDREDFINYYPENVEQGKEHNFKVYSTTFGHGPFDFESIMLYASTDFGKLNPDGSKKTVLKRKDGSTWGSNTGRSTVSFGDVRTVISMHSNIYVVQNNTLYAVSPEGGQFYTSLGSGWSGTAPIIAEDDRYIWAIQGGNLWRTDRFNGDYQKVGNEDWSGPVVGITGAEPGGFFYAQQGIRLWKIGSNGKRARLGGVNALENWSGTQAICYLNGALYVIWKNTLYKINITTGLVDKQYGGIWSNIKGMAAVRRSADNLYIMVGSDLWKINVKTGHFSLVGSGYFNTTAMTGVAGRLYIASDGWLHKVDENGFKIWAVSGYKGVTSMGATNFAGLFD